MKARRMIGLFIAALMLLAACQFDPSWLVSGKSPDETPVATADPTPSGGKNPLGWWEGDPFFKHAQVIIPNVEKHPILLTETVALDWERMRAYALEGLPPSAKLQESGATAGSPPDDMARLLTASGYQTEHGAERTIIQKTLARNAWGYQRTFDDRYHIYNCVLDAMDGSQTDVLEPAADIATMRTGAHEAARIVEEALRDWGMDISNLSRRPLRMHYSIPYRYPPDARAESPEDLRVWEKEPNYLIEYRNVLYGIPVFSGQYVDRQNDSVRVCGDYVQAAVNDLGLRSLTICCRTVVQVEREDVTVIPLEQVITSHASAIQEQLIEPAARIELMYVPLYLPETPHVRVRLVPAWCFFVSADGLSYAQSQAFTLIDATTGMIIA